MGRAGRTFLPLLNNAGGCCFQIVGPADPGEKVDEGGGIVVLIAAQLRRLVIPWEDMMVVVPTLA